MSAPIFVGDRWGLQKKHIAKQKKGVGKKKSRGCIFFPGNVMFFPGNVYKWFFQYHHQKKGWKQNVVFDGNSG